MHKIAISGLVALTAVLGGLAVPAAAIAQSTAADRPASAVPAGSAIRAASAAVLREERAALADGATTDGPSGVPLISCVLATDCIGIQGSSQLTDGTSIPTRVARWNGSSWKGLGVALPKGTKSADLNGVSCKGAKSCLVVGDYYTSNSGDADNYPLALAYNGTSLKPTTSVPLPKGTQGATLSGVSCVTTTDCVALGVADGETAAFGQSGSLILIETWNGAKWTLHTAAGSSGKTSVELNTVACATSAFCVLAGDTATITAGSSFTSGLYLASWNGKKLTAMKAAGPSLTGSSVALAAGASCATASNCAITGADLSDLSPSTADITAFTEIWNGKTWQLGQVTWPKGIKVSFTVGVSCYAAHTCEAVGIDGASAADTASYDAAAVSFNGAAGALETVPAPSKGHSNEFTDVSCLPWGSCVAIGQTGKTTAKSPAVMTGVWNGKAWKLEPGF